MDINEWTLIVGVVTAPFGIRGEMKVHLETDFPERFKRLKQVSLQVNESSSGIYQVYSSRLHKGQALLKLEGIDSIEQADPFRGALVRIRMEDAQPLPSGEYYIHDLIGCSVISDTGLHLGVLTGVLRGAANDVYVVGEGKTELLLPAISQVILQVDLAEKRIIISPSPGLLQNYDQVLDCSDEN